MSDGRCAASQPTVYRSTWVVPPLTGIAAGTLTRLRKALGLRDEPVKVDEPYQVLGRVDNDLRQALGVDTIDLASPTTLFGYRTTSAGSPGSCRTARTC